MQNFQWNNNSFDSEEEGVAPKSTLEGMTVEETNETIQLKKFQDPAKDEQRQSLQALVQKFGVLFASGSIHSIAQDLLTEDFEIFVFNSNEQASVRNAYRPQGFIEIFKDIKISERCVRETDIDSEKNAVCQICAYKISYESNSTPIEEVACEIFSIRDGRISKYRASFGNPELNDPTKDPLEPTKKDRMLAKVKQINYALAGQPDFERVRSLLDENVEYKIWRWGDFKCFTLNKNDFISSFKELEENMSIRCIVPYEISVDTQAKVITATYVYHLEDNSSGLRYDWLSSCIYAFDDNINITKVRQQGELYPEGESKATFEVHSREKLEKIIHNFAAPEIWNLDMDLFDSTKFVYDCIVWTICQVCPPGVRCFQGFKQVGSFLEKKEMFKHAKPELVKALDIFVDHHNKSHDIVFAVGIAQGAGLGFHGQDEETKEPGNVIVLFRGSFENGKLAKSLFFMSKIGEPIESPFDDKTFNCLNIK